MGNGGFRLAIRAGHPDFLDLPWERGLSDWTGHCLVLEDLPRGASRHTVEFVNCDGVLYAIKELPAQLAEREYDHLLRMEDLGLPAVQAVGHAAGCGGEPGTGALITRYLDNSLPYSQLFRPPTGDRTRESLLDALAGLLVQLHLSGVFWGDCSLYNTLFRRDAGRLQAYLVDAETTEIHPSLTPGQRGHDLAIMQENVTGGLLDLVAAGQLDAGFPAEAVAASVRDRYLRLWEEITREVLIGAGERYRIQERIRTLNNLGFSVSELELSAVAAGDALRLKVVVTDRNFHRSQLQGLTGIAAEERQAQQLMNEIREQQATLSSGRGSSVPLSVAAWHWRGRSYEPALAQLSSLRRSDVPEQELYCRLLEHKWLLSERERRDVGHEAAIIDLLAHPPGE